MDCPGDLKYTKSHEWAKINGDTISIGLTDYAQESLGDIVHIELPEEGQELSTDDVFGEVESVKAVSDLYAPISGKVSEVNAALIDSPEAVNDDPYGEAWLIKLKVGDSSEVDKLMDAEKYKAYVEEESNK